MARRAAGGYQIKSHKGDIWKPVSISEVKKKLSANNNEPERTLMIINDGVPVRCKEGTIRIIKER